MTHVHGRVARPGMARSGHFSGWPVTFAPVGSLTGMDDFVRNVVQVATPGRCPR